jgi:thioredoxin-like negative regulator of GroEL
VAKQEKQRKNDTGATVGYEAQLWEMADALRGSMDAAEYKHVCLGLLFLKYISDAFEEKHAALLAEKAQGADPEDPDEYRAQSIFWVPPEARWPHLKARLAANPADHDARLALAALHAGARRYRESLDELLEIVRAEKNWKEGEARRQILAIFNLAEQQPELVSEYRRKLASALY